MCCAEGNVVPCENGTQTWKGYWYPGLITSHPTGTEDYSIRGKFKGEPPGPLSPSDGFPACNAMIRGCTLSHKKQRFQPPLKWHWHL